MSAYLENAAVATRLENMFSIVITKKNSAKEYSKYYTLCLFHMLARQSSKSL